MAGGWRGLGKDEIKWEGILYADKFSSDTINWIGGTAGSILFIDTNSLITQNNSNLFWDNTNNRLGIKTATPGYDLEVNGEYIAITNVNAELLFRTSAGNKQSFYLNGNDIRLFDYATGVTDRVIFKTGGKVGIGTMSPNSTLQVDFDSNDTSNNAINNPTARLSNFNTTNGNYAGLMFTSKDTGGTERASAMIQGIFLNRTATQVDSELGFFIRDMSGGGGVKQAIRIDKNGNIGIGTTTPQSALHIAGASGSIMFPNVAAPTLGTATGACFVSGGAFFFKGSSGTVTLLAAA